MCLFGGLWGIEDIRAARTMALSVARVKFISFEQRKQLWHAQL